MLEGLSVARWYSSSADDEYDLEGGPQDYRCARRDRRSPENLPQISPYGEILSYERVKKYAALITTTQLSLKHDVYKERRQKGVAWLLYFFRHTREFLTLIGLSQIDTREKE